MFCYHRKGQRDGNCYGWQASLLAAARMMHLVWATVANYSLSDECYRLRGLREAYIHQASGLYLVFRLH